jgi:hypothetical protein
MVITCFYTHNVHYSAFVENSYTKIELEIRSL